MLACACLACSAGGRKAAAAEKGVGAKVDLVEALAAAGFDGNGCKEIAVINGMTGGVRP
jgi:hypothetical protein